MLTQVFGTLGLFVQAAIFVLVFASSGSGDRNRGAFYGAVSAVYGYSLVLAITMLFGIPWGFTNIVLLTGVALLISQRRVRTRIVENLSGIMPGIRRNLVAIVILSIVALFQIGIAALKPELSVDGQLYHGPTMVQMIQQGTLWGWQVPSEYLYYSDLSMISGINLSTFTGHVIFDDAMQIQHLIVLILAINWALESRFRSSFTRVSFALLIVASPVIWLQARVLYVDLAYGAAVAATIFILVLTSGLKRRDLIILGVTIGAVVGTKPAGVLTGGLLVAVSVGLAIWQYRRARPIPKQNLVVPGSLFFLAVFSGFSFYVRNFIAFGSPTYPVETDIGPFHFRGILQLSLVSGDPSGKTVDPLHVRSYLATIWHGMTGGLVKLDYDPRVGGFGYVPLIVAVLALILFIFQLARWLSFRKKPSLLIQLWRPQLGLVLLAFLVVLIQPAAGNSRYVIGPTAVLLTAILLTTLGLTLQRAEALIGIVALCAAVIQVAWTESKMFPGINQMVALFHLNAENQPLSPGNPWGQSDAVSWLPANSCVQISLETSGGVQPGGLMESTRFATFPYGLYGSQLCNSVQTIALQNYVGENGKPILNSTRDTLNSSDYLVVYSDHVEQWKSRLEVDPSCIVTVANVPGVQGYPQNETVLRNMCVAR